MLDDWQVSRQHAQLQVRDGAITIADLGTANGTTVNGARIGGTIALHPGDTIGIGATTLRLVPMQNPTPRQPTAGPARKRGPLLVGVSIALALLLCVCGTASLALIVGGRDGTPTSEVAFAPTAALGPTPDQTIAPTPAAVPPSASLPTSVAITSVAIPAIAPTATAQRPTPTVSRPVPTIPNAAQPTATAKPQAPSARPSGNVGGTYSGKVQRGYTITFRVSPDGKQISDVRARALTDCGTGRSSDTTFAPDTTFAVGPDGRFAGEGEYQPGFRYEFAGQLSGASATGYLRDSSIVVGAVCDTHRLEWAAKRQAP